MAFDPFTSLFNLLSTGLEKAIPDANLREQTARDMATQLNGVMQGQIALNLKEAESQNFFVAGWRPAMGWTCVTAYLWQFIVQPFLTFVLTALAVHMDIAQLPKLDLGELSFVLFAMLGIGTLRTVEKSRGIS